MRRSPIPRADQWCAGTICAPSIPGDRDPVSPVAGHHACVRHGLPDDGIVAERGDDEGSVRGLQPAQRCDVEMVVVIVRQQHGIDRRQIGKGDPGCGHSARPGEADGTGPIGPERIGENVEARGLDQQRRMPDHRDPQPLDALIRHDRMDDDRLGPFCRRLTQLPSQHRAQRAIGIGVGRIEEAQAIEMVRSRPVIIGIPASHAMRRSMSFPLDGAWQRRMPAQCRWRHRTGAKKRTALAARRFLVCLETDDAPGGKFGRRRRLLAMSLARLSPKFRD
jgi:hypothetical protein